MAKLKAIIKKLKAGEVVDEDEGETMELAKEGDYEGQDDGEDMATL